MTEPAMSGDGFGVAGLIGLLPALVVCGFIPGWVAAGALGVREGFARSGLAVLLSGLLTFAVGAASLAVTGGVFAAASGLTIFAGGLLAARLFARLPLGPAGGLRPSWSAAAVALLTLLVLAVFVANPELRHRVDGWFHGAVTARLLAVGLPPDDPYFSGLRLNYPWAWHVLLATTAQAGARLGVSAFDAMAGWSALAALATGAWLVVLGRSWATAAGLGAALRDRVGALAVALAMLGTNPLGGIFWLGRGLLGNEGGASELARLLTGGASEAMLATTWNYPHVSLASPLDKFFTPTAFGLAEAAVLGFGALALFPIVAEGRRRFVLVTAVALVALFVHVASGLAVCAIALAAMLLALRRDEAARRWSLVPALAVALALAMATPYLMATHGTYTEGRVLLAARSDLWLAVGLVGGLLIALAAREAWRFGEAPVALRAWLLVACLLLAAAGTMQLVQRNETKFVNLALLALAVPAAAAVARLRPALIGALLIVLVPTHAVAVTGFLLDRGAETPGRRIPPPALRQAYEWIARRTGPADLFLEAVPAGATDPDRDLLVHGPRALVWGGRGYASNWGYPARDLAWRRVAAEELATGRLSPTTLDALRARTAGTGEVLYAVRRGAPAARPDLPGGGPDAAWTRVFANDSLALDRLDPPPGRTAGATSARTP